MQRQTLPVLAAAWSLVSCVAGPPDFEAAPAPMVDASGNPVDGGIRVLSGAGGARDASQLMEPVGASDARPAVPASRDATASVGLDVTARDVVSKVPDAPGNGPVSMVDRAIEAAVSPAARPDAAALPRLGCSAVLACARRAPALAGDCLDAALPLERAPTEIVLACQFGPCLSACQPLSSLSECNACLLRACASDVTACARRSGCGDGRLDAEEECDDGNLDDRDVCTSACTVARCGDGIVQDGGEECDDGNQVDSDGCLTNCRLASCGDGVLANGEGCDDRNQTDGDGCSGACRIETCGNGLRDPGEECDEGPANGAEKPCLPTCHINRCADGWICRDELAGCGSRLGTRLEECDDGNDRVDDGCVALCRIARCGDGYLQSGVEMCDDGNTDSFDGCSSRCAAAASHLLISEIVTRPAGAEMIEIANPTKFAVELSGYLLSDSHLYDRITSGSFSTASGSDFAARFPAGSIIGASAYRTVALANASGGTVSFAATYGKKPDFELRPTANGAIDDLEVSNMLPAQEGSSIGATASLTDGGEPVVLFYYRGGGPVVYDVDYVFYGAASGSNPVVDKTAELSYQPDTPAGSQRAAPLPLEGGSLHRCDFTEPGETRGNGNGLIEHDETSEDVSRSFVLVTLPALRTPGGPPPDGVCPD